MAARTTHDYLVALKNVIVKERQQATKLNLDGLYSAMKEKEDLIRVLAHVKILNEEDLSIAAEIKHENRRNAYLFKTTLGWIRETMEFFGKKTMTSTYSASANTIDSEVNGRLLSGRI